MSSITASSWTPAPTSAGAMTATNIGKDVCTTCQKKLPKLDENLLKHSLRMKSELAQLNTQKKSLMHMLARNEDFVYPITPRGGANSDACSAHSIADTTRLIERDNYNSKINQYAEVMTNRGLRDCEKLQTHSRKHEYKRWDFSHQNIANYNLQPGVQTWLDDEDESNSVGSENSDDEMKKVEELSLDDRGHVVGVSFSRTTKTGERTTRRELESKDGEEDIPEPARVRRAIENIRRGTRGGMLTEIQQIKDRHRQLEALTETKKRALADTTKMKRSRKQLKRQDHEKDSLRKFLLANANLQKELEFNEFKEKTTVKLDRKFSNAPAEAKHPGVVWAPKWNPKPSHVPGKILKSTHPVSDANRKHANQTFAPAMPGDLPACVYLPKHIEAKTPMESALLLERFIKETVKSDYQTHRS